MSFSNKNNKMLINRKNYEDFFLLYADGELCLSEKEEVEEFIAANTDLKQEFEMLLATILPEEAIVFSDKRGLYKNETVDVVAQEKLFLFIDGELSAKENADLNLLLRTDEALQKEHTVLLQTKLAEEKIICPDKHLLYRKEKSDPVMLPYIRWAAAAAIIGLGLLIGLSRFNTGKDEVAVYKTTVPVSPEDVQAVKKTPIFLPQRVDEKTSVASAKNKSVKIDEIHSEPNQPIVKNIPAKSKDNSSPVTKPVEQGLVASDKKIIPAEVMTPQTNDIAQSIASVKASPDLSLPVKENKITEKESAISNAQSLVSGSNESPNKIFYIDEDDVKRSRPFGFLKKAKRFVERTANLKPGNTLRIAGFEFKGS